MYECTRGSGLRGGMMVKLYAWQFENPQFKPRPVTNLLTDFYVPFGIDGLKAINKTCNESGLSAEAVLLANILHRLKVASYTDKDIERVLEEDNLVGQVDEWIAKNRRMLKFGDGGVFKTLKFKISPREIPEGPI